MVSLTSLVFSEGTLETQLTLVVIWATIWFFVIPYAAKNIFEPFVASKPWKDKWVDLNDKTFQTGFFIHFKTKAEVFEFACLFLAIICQHALGGFLCIPSLVGASGAGVAALACHGGLCEAGWELQDAMVRIYQVLFGGPAGKEKNPTPLMVILFIHHAMGLSMVIPMNIVYHDNVYYHEFVFLLQFAAFVALGLQNYGYTLDVKTASGLAQMKVCTGVTVSTMLWSRAGRYAMVGYYLITTMYADGNTKMLCLGAVVLGLMGLLNILMVVDGIGKFVKFMKMHHENEDIHDDLVRMHSSFMRHSASQIGMTKSHKEWSKVRGAVLMGAALKSKGKSGDKKKE
jgi:hypothetical protein